MVNLVSPERGDVGCADRGVHAVGFQSSAASAAAHRTKGPCVVEKSVNSVSAFGATREALLPSNSGSALHH